MSKKTIHIGTIRSTDKIAIGHQSHISGCGVHRDRKRDKKLRRKEGNRICRNW